jgi:hypothetical protein
MAAAEDLLVEVGAKFLEVVETVRHGSLPNWKGGILPHAAACRHMNRPDGGTPPQAFCEKRLQAAENKENECEKERQERTRARKPLTAGELDGLGVEAARHA